MTTCKYCNNQFDNKGRNRKFCSATCYHKYRKGKPHPSRKNRPILECDTCNKPFSIAPSRLKHGNPRFCSTDCFYKWLKGSERAPRTEITCNGCGGTIRMLVSQYHNHKYEKYYCNEQCMFKHRTPPNPKVKKIKRVCAVCSKSFEVYPSQLRKDKCIFCSNKCAIIGRKPQPLRTVHTIKLCQYCNKEMSLMPSEAKQRFCSQACAYAYHGPTDIEEILMNLLNNANVDYHYQYPVDKWTIDFAFPNIKLAIEADGMYWHSDLPTQERDERKGSALRADGWTVIRFSGDTIRQSPNACIEKILEYI